MVYELLLMNYSLQVIIPKKKDMGYLKKERHAQESMMKKKLDTRSKYFFKREREKRCIPKEGMPHAHKACQKREKI